MLKHQSILNIYVKNNKIFNILFSCNNHEEFQKIINKESDNYINYSYTSKEKLLGDLYEIFIECFLTYFKDNRIGIENYEPLPLQDDNGVDGLAIGITKGQKISIQIKYRSNPTTMLLSDDLKQFGFQSIVKYNIDYKDNERNMILITNCQGLDYYSEHNVFLDKIRIINGNNISSYVNGIDIFWSESLKKIINKVNIIDTFIPKKEYIIDGILYLTARKKDGDLFILINKNDINISKKYNIEELKMLSN